MELTTLDKVHLRQLKQFTSLLEAWGNVEIWSGPDKTIRFRYICPYTGCPVEHSAETLLHCLLGSILDEISTTPE